MSPEVDIGGVAVVTGAGSGIGRATALRLGGLGATVHAADIDAQSAEATAGEIRSRGGTATAHALDVADANAVEVMAAEVFAADGRVDVLHNNAGIAHSGPVEETPLEDWRRIVEINLMGVIHGVHAFVPRMLRQGGESQIVNTASGLGLIAGVELAPYCTTKFAVVGLSGSLNAELRPRGIGVTALCPGIIATNIVTESTARGDMAARKQRIADFYARRGASPDVVAEAVVRAVRKRRVVQTVPASHVVPAWIACRVSLRAGQAAARLTHRLAQRM